MTFVESNFRRMALAALVALARGVAHDVAPAKARAASQRLSRHQRQSQGRARHLLSGHRRRAGAIVDQHSRVPRRLRLVRGDLPGQSRLDALDLSAGMVPGLLLLRCATTRRASAIASSPSTSDLTGTTTIATGRSMPSVRGGARRLTAKAGPIAAASTAGWRLTGTGSGSRGNMSGCRRMSALLASLHGRPLGVHRALWLDVGVQ